MSTKARKKITEPRRFHDDETADFRQFVADYPAMEASARMLDKEAHEALKDKYTYFDQGTYDVIYKRTLPEQDHIQAVPGGRDPDHKAGERVKYLCEVCNKYKVDIRRHMETHNMSPGQSLYCPLSSCLQRMSRNDTVTAVEHLVTNHPDWVFGGEPRNMHEVYRFKQLCDTDQSKVLNRLNLKAIQHFIRKDHARLLGTMEGIYLRHVRELQEHVGIDIDALDKVVAAQEMDLNENGLATVERIDSLKKKGDAIAYLLAVRNIIKQMETNEVEN